MTPPAPSELLFVTPVWGESYVERFLGLSLPTQLAPGNLPALATRPCRYLVYTLRAFAPVIRQAPVFAALQRLLPVEVECIDDHSYPTIEGNPHELQNAAYSLGIAAGVGRNAAYVFLTPDLLMGDGTGAYLLRAMADGKRVVLAAGLRMTAAGAAACVGRHLDADRLSAAVPPRAMVADLLAHMHPLSVGHIMTDEGVRMPQHLYWLVGSGGLLARGFHLHPLLVWPTCDDATIRRSLDGAFIDQACPDPAHWQVVTDSDDALVVEFSTPGHKRECLPPAPLTDHEVVEFMFRETTPIHRQLVRLRLRFLAADPDPAAWQAVEARSDSYVRQVLQLHAAAAAAHGRLTELESALISNLAYLRAHLDQRFLLLQTALVPADPGVPTSARLDQLAGEVRALGEAVSLLTQRLDRTPWWRRAFLSLKRAILGGK